ncbi:hypothetical protein IVB41_35275 [Bradyrhizobium sp. 44]|uniref:hypothetical protein n=1 Tax=unclassified Bradyrhizobium TaxID=2631580 RepID=UPI001FF81836|nr:MULTISPECIES: hypothetical protein [unclassified Bradyrhizobium]MCK1289157.1 hypothetical protein [Bradyrhizobium sp. 44]MCK1363344.1 hypothetical protein [Bradyrhizobium sp. 62]MCK1399026.1 hypothetical protein [Bradyrhizobium sp. 39]MCK1749468.1 hypothetical protein [Bradyrhizobium sp. 135]UPJ35638.1 hypothetical protein IVB45_01085 [Bradyrhizobium sp. 4]
MKHITSGLLQVRYCSGSRWWAVEDRSNDVAANNVLVVQVRAVRTISRSLPVPAARALSMIRKSVQRFSDKIMLN